MPIHFKLSEAAEKSGMSIRRLARDSEVDYKTLHLLKTGKQNGLSFPVLERICRALNCEPADLFEIVSDEPKHSTARRITRSRKTVRKTTIPSG